MDLGEQIEKSIVAIEKQQESVSNQVKKIDKRVNLFNIWAWIFVATGLIVGVVFTIIFLRTPKESSYFEWNLLGDFLSGSVASLWSLAGLFFIYVAFLGQKQQLLNQQLELKFNQIEVKNTRLELAGQKQEMIIQNETLKLQKFENTFFNLLNLLNSVVNNIDIRNVRTQDVVNIGRDCFKTFYDDFVSNIMNNNKENHEFNIKDSSVEENIKAYDKLYNDNKSDLSHYFRSVYHILKFIDKSEIEDKKQYIGLLRAQISSYEQAIIFYNCLHDYGSKFKLLAEKHSFLKNLDTNLIISETHCNEFKDSAFGNM